MGRRSRTDHRHRVNSVAYSRSLPAPSYTVRRLAFRRSLVVINADVSPETCAASSTGGQCPDRAARGRLAESGAGVGDRRNTSEITG